MDMCMNVLSRIESIHSKKTPASVQINKMEGEIAVACTLTFIIMIW